MPARTKYYHARKIDAQRFGSIAAESEVVGNFLQLNLGFEPVRGVAVEETVGHACDVISNTS